jgi:hypothetical protein
MKKGSSFKEWFVENEEIILEGLFDDLAYKLDNVEELKDQPNTVKLLKDIISLYLKKYKIKPTLTGGISKEPQTTPEQDSNQLNVLLSRVPWDIKPALDNLLRTGNIDSFRKHLQEKPTGSSF